MSEYVTAQRKITFKTGLPLGRHATFIHDKEEWIAVPRSKYRAITTVTDRLIGALDRIRGEATRWVSTHPHDAPRTMLLLGIIGHADETAKAATGDKIKAQTA